MLACAQLEHRTTGYVELQARPRRHALEVVSERFEMNLVRVVTSNRDATRDEIFQQSGKEPAENLPATWQQRVAVSALRHAPSRESLVHQLVAAQHGDGTPSRT